MSFADTLSDKSRKEARILAYASTWSGCISEVMLDSSAIIILLFTMLKSSSMVTMFSTSISGIMSLLLMIPNAWIADKIGLKRAVKYACITGCIGFLLIAFSPFLQGDAAILCAVAGTFIYASQRSLYSSAWYPLLDNFLKADERGKFFAFMRTSYMLFTGVLFFLIGLLLGKQPPFWLMQIVIGIAGVAMLLRWFCISRFPEDPAYQAGSYRLKKSLSISIHNAPLTGYSVYICLLSIGYTVLVPLTLLYLKEYIRMEAGAVQIISSVGILGSIAGYSLYGYLTRRVKLKYLELGVHLLFILMALAMFLLRQDTPGFSWIVGTLLFLISIANASMLCNNSMELLALGKPGNKTMAMAFCQTYMNFGVTIGRSGSSLLLGAAMLSPVWSFGGREFCIYQSVFLISAVFLLLTLVLIPILPSFVPEHEDYYNSADRTDRKQ